MNVPLRFTSFIGNSLVKRFPTGCKTMTRCIHFVGFRGDEYLSAVRVWGRPDFIHRGWDRRAQREIADGDTVIFAGGPADQEPCEKSFDDIRESPHTHTEQEKR